MNTLHDNHAMARSPTTRTSYLDPLNRSMVMRGIHLTINGIAAGLRNSG